MNTSATNWAFDGGDPARRASVSRWGRRALWAVVLASALVACRTSEPNPPTVVDHFDLVANVPVAAAQLEITRPVGTTGVTVVALQPDVVVRVAEVGDRIHVVWLGPVAVAGAQVRLDVERAEGTTGGAEIVVASAYASSAGPDVGAGAFAWRTVAASVEIEGPVGIGGVDFEGMGMDPLVLAPSFADHPLGDLDESFSLDIRDALVWLDLVRYGSWTDFSRYHADFDADDDADADDLTELLDKLVDPALPARLHVRPDALSFVELDPAPGEDAIVLVGNRGRQPFAALSWDVPTGIATATVGGVVGQSTALRLSLEQRSGWVPGFARVSDGTGGEVAVRLGNLVFLIGGQSNASGRGQPVAPWPEVASPFVRTLANDYRWRAATEPLDSASGQLDGNPDQDFDYNAAYSFGTRLGHLLQSSTGFPTYLIPAAHGGTSIAEWLPASDPFNRDTFFGSANFRAHVSAALVANPAVPSQTYPAEGGPVTALLWYQGETDAGAASKRGQFVASTNQVFDRLGEFIDVPVVYVQLASHGIELDHERQLLIAELQRQMETGSGYAARSERFMVVAFDLPRSDVVHLSAFGQRVLAERIELAVREHVLGEDVDGTGPRLVAVEHVGGRRIDITTTHELAGTVDPAHVRVFDGPPANLDAIDDPTVDYGTNALTVASVAIDPTDARVVRVTLAADPPAGSDLHIGYWAIYESKDLTKYPEMWDVLAPGVIRAAVGGLPLPAFGPIQVQ